MLVRLIAVCGLLLLVGCGGAAERRVPVIDTPPPWTESLRRQFGLEQVRMGRCSPPNGSRARVRRLGRRQLRLQARVARAEVARSVHRAMGRDWGHVWFDHCDRGRFKVGVTPTPVRELRAELAAARGALRRAGILGQTDFVAVRSTIRELSRYQDALDDRFEPLLEEGMFSSGLNPMLNAVTLTVWIGMDSSDRSALEQESRDAPVNVVIKWSNTRPIAHH